MFKVRLRGLSLPKTLEPSGGRPASSTHLKNPASVSLYMCSVFLNMWLFPEFWVLRSVIPGSSKGLGFLGMITGLSGVFSF